MTSEVTQADERDGLLPGGYTADEKALLDSLGGYQHVFNAIADATSVYAEGVGVNIGVRAFIRSINPHRLTAQSGEGRSGAGEDALLEALADIFAAWDAHVEANDRTNAAIPAINATRAERAVYDERYRSSDEARREWYRAMHRFIENPAARAALNARQSGEGDKK